MLWLTRNLKQQQRNKTHDTETPEDVYIVPATCWLEVSVYALGNLDMQILSFPLS
jgi:hypothetical protein